ncbi:hypothetical protein SAMN04487939_10696 [Lysobacter sp. yr284]|uniref:hypothetical protein n=1 Tax=Lysobacter sp. yr284 TaxID=1761791 RepID=UPI000894477B|nr:hypothetical protein [Lysobacter sp. yr284]SDY78996.1 hypothetical protein SAMN04487939_10696 [Lysobacter sp. yr284]
MGDPNRVANPPPPPPPNPVPAEPNPASILAPGRATAGVDPPIPALAGSGQGTALGGLFINDRLFTYRFERDLSPIPGGQAVSTGAVLTGLDGTTARLEAGSSVGQYTLAVSGDPRIGSAVGALRVGDGVNSATLGGAINPGTGANMVFGSLQFDRDSIAARYGWDRNGSTVGVDGRHGLPGGTAVTGAYEYASAADRHRVSLGYEGGNAGPNLGTGVAWAPNGVNFNAFANVPIGGGEHPLRLGASGAYDTGTRQGSALATVTAPNFLAPNLNLDLSAGAEIRDGRIAGPQVDARLRYAPPDAGGANAFIRFQGNHERSFIGLGLSVPFGGDAPRARPSGEGLPGLQVPPPPDRRSANEPQTRGLDAAPAEPRIGAPADAGARRPGDLSSLLHDLGNGDRSALAAAAAMAPGQELRRAAIAEVDRQQAQHAAVAPVQTAQAPEQPDAPSRGARSLG